MTTSFFSGANVAPEADSTNALIDQLTAQVATVTAANSQAQAAASLAASAANNAIIAEGNVSTLAQQANDTLAAAQAATASVAAAVTTTTTNAATSTNQANIATAQAGQAANSATAAAAAASSVATAATNAGNSATAAAGSASAALTSQNAAAGSATTATNQATAAGTSATNASNSATAAAGSATTATGAASTATTQASAASGSATAAAGSATAAGTSASSAAASAAAAAANLGNMANHARVINGGFGYSQRAAAALTGTVASYVADTWQTSINGAGGTLTPSVGTLVYGGITYNCGTLTATTAPTNIGAGNLFGGFLHTIESADCYDMQGAPAVLQFLCKSPVAGVHSVVVGIGTQFYVTTVTVATANVAQAFVVAIPTIPNVGLINGPAAGITIRVGTLNTATYQCPSGSQNAWQGTTYVSAQGAVNWAATSGNALSITRVKINPGTVAEPFLEDPAALVTLRCQRRYRQFTVIFNTVTGNMYAFPPMRATPTIAVVSAASGTGGAYSVLDTSGVYQGVANSVFAAGVLGVSADL